MDQPLSTSIPTAGHMLRKAATTLPTRASGTDKQFDSTNADRLFTTEMEAYGFSDFLWHGDVVGHTLRAQSIT
jgi:arylsulfatase